MIRTLLTTVTLLALASSGLSQGIRGKAPPPRIPPQHLQPPLYFNGYNGYTSPFINPFANRYYLPYGFGYPYYVPVPAVPLQATVTQSTSNKLAMPTVVTPARFQLKFPVAAKVWLNGTEQEGSQRAWTLSAPDTTKSYPFDVQARWTIDGQEYEWKRSIKVAQGETASATVLRGRPVK